MLFPLTRTTTSTSAPAVLPLCSGNEFWTPCPTHGVYQHLILAVARTCEVTKGRALTVSRSGRAGLNVISAPDVDHIARQASPHADGQLAVRSDVLRRHRELERQLRQDHGETRQHLNLRKTSPKALARSCIEHRVFEVAGAAAHLEPTLGMEFLGVLPPDVLVPSHAIDVVHHHGASGYQGTVRQHVVVGRKLGVDGNGRVEAECLVEDSLKVRQVRHVFVDATPHPADVVHLLSSLRLGFRILAETKDGP
mmetsp:Transcript_53200/g.142291  ORF Transcript_53200/g.142291 Transcript_53200/m.142291 type:complete len:252 (+) Transcript_53200:217-972(+)